LARAYAQIKIDEVSIPVDQRQRGVISITTKRQQLPADSKAAKFLRDWKTAYTGYGVGHYVLVLLGIVAGAIVGASAAANFLGSTTVAILGILAGIAVAVTNALDTGGNYKRFNKAYAKLSGAVMKYEDGNATLIDVENAYLTGENIINEKTEEVTGGKKTD
jgi:hypothetical protein